jgi:hypothetical protein
MKSEDRATLEAILEFVLNVLDSLDCTDDQFLCVFEKDGKKLRLNYSIFDEESN